MSKVMPFGLVACLLVGFRCEELQSESGRDAQVCAPDAPSGDCAAGEPDADVPDDGFDAGGPEPVEPGEPMPPDSMPPTDPTDPMQPPVTAQLNCDTIEDAPLPAGLELFASFDGISVLTADAERVYGMRFGDGEEIWARDAAVNDAELVSPGHDLVQVLVADGGEVFFNSATSGRDVVVSKVPASGGEVVNIAREDYANVNALIVDGSHAFWLANAGYYDPGVTVLFRSEREPGETVALARIPGEGVPNALLRLGDALYFAVHNYSTGTTQLYRFALNSESDSDAEPLGAPQSIAALATDGSQLFAGLVGSRDGLGNRGGLRGVVRVNLEDGSVVPLFPELATPAGLLAVDASKVYWLSPTSQPNSQLWGGNKDGTDEPKLIARGWRDTTGLTQNAAGIYWTVRCDPTDHVIRIVR